MYRRKPLVTPAVGQVWSFTAGSIIQQRIAFKIQNIADNNGELRAYGKSVGTGKPLSISVATLRRGMRNARIERHANGRVAKHVVHVETVREKPKTASDYRRSVKPRGVVQRDITLFETRVTQLKAKGWSDALVAKQLRCAEDKVRTAVRNVESIRARMAIEEM